MLYKFIKPVKFKSGWKKERQMSPFWKKYKIPLLPNLKLKELMQKLAKTKDKIIKFLKHPKFFKVCLVLFIVFILLSLASVAWLASGLPDPNQLMERQVAQSTKIYDRTGETVLYEIHGNEKRTIVNLSEIPAHVKWATIDIEDKDFYKHGGFSLWAMFRTVVTNVLLGRKAGGSTLTQQFIKNAILTPEKSYIRKAKELILAYRLEKKFSKDEILQMYFNEIPYGSTAYGVEAASQKYFGKSVRDINMAEAAVLAALPQAPSRYSPYGSNKNLLIARQQYVLDLMVEQGHASKTEADEAKKTKLVFKELSDNIIAPHFVMYIKELLSDKYGSKMVEENGLKIYTTLDLYKQRAAEKAITDHAPKNEKNYQATNASLVSLDPKTGQVLAMVGSKDYFDNEIDGQVNVALQPRQPGSSFKPIVYAASFIKGYTPDTVLYDVNTNFSTDPAKPYKPQNYNGKENGPVTIRQALAGSLNIPAVKTIYLAGINNVLDLADSLGYTTLKDRSRFGLSLVLGGGEIKLVEHINAYSAFAREGKLAKLSYILKIEDKEGNLIEEYKNEEKNIFPAEIGRQINDILSDNSARAYIFGEKNWLTLPNRPVAAKTGTTNDNKDAWTIGYTPSLVTGVWVGNNDSQPMKVGADGSVIAAPIWNDYMKTVLGDTPVESFKKPEIIKTGKPILDGNINGEYSIKIDRASGLLATEYTPANFIEEKRYSQNHCILFFIDKNDPRGSEPKDPTADPQFNLWENSIFLWAQKNNKATSSIPTEYDNLHTPENLPQFIINQPFDNQAIETPFLSANIDASAPRGINRVNYLIDDFLLAQTFNPPFALEENITFLANGYHKLSIVVCDDIDNCTKKNININIRLDSNQPTKEISAILLQPDYKNIFNKKDPIITVLTQINNYPQVSRAELFVASETSTPLLIKSYENIENEKIVTNWPNPGTIGSFEFFVNIFGWQGQQQKSNILKIQITE